MGIAGENVFTFGTGTHPDFEAINSTGAATQDGTEIIAEGWNNFILGPWQAMFNYGGITPDGVTESQSASQYLEALRLGHAIGPGIGKFWFKADTPAVTGDRALVLSNQTVLIASYADLVSACYVGDGNNATAPYFYKSSDSGGVTRSTSGTYFTLPPQNYTFLKSYSAYFSGGSGDAEISGGVITAASGNLTPFKEDGSGVIKMLVDLTFTTSGASLTTFVTVAGVTFDKRSSLSLSNKSNAGTMYADVLHAHALDTTDDIAYISARANEYYLNGIVELTSWPTWADDFDYPVCITY